MKNKDSEQFVQLSPMIKVFTATSTHMIKGTILIEATHTFSTVSNCSIFLSFFITSLGIWYFTGFNHYEGQISECKFALNSSHWRLIRLKITTCISKNIFICFWANHDSIVNYNKTITLLWHFVSLINNDVLVKYIIEPAQN